MNEGQMKPVLVKIRDYYMGALTSETDLKVRLERTVIGMVNMFGDSRSKFGELFRCGLSNSVGAGSRIASWIDADLAQAPSFGQSGLVSVLFSRSS